MKKNYTTTVFLYFTCIIFLMVSCKPDIDIPDTQRGELDFTHFTALGSGYVAGLSNTDYLHPDQFSDLPSGGYYEEAQHFSFPNILAYQLNQVQDVMFVQPTIEAEGNGYLRIDAFDQNACPEEVEQPILTVVPATPNWASRTSPKVLHNLGIPQMKLSEIESTSLSNPYFSRMMPDSASPQMSYLEWLKEYLPRKGDGGFYCIWMGVEDVLHSALLGGQLPRTPREIFNKKMDSLLDAVYGTHPNAKGVILNIPDITQLPYFNQYRHQFRHPQNNCELATLRISRERDDTLASKDDYILLSAGEKLKNKRVGSGELPLDNKLVLDKYEALEMHKRIAAYNTHLEKAVKALNSSGQRIILVDIAALFDKIYGGYTENGIRISAEHIRGGIFSADGIHLSPRGNALIANEIIKAINTQFKGTKIPMADIAAYKGVEVQ